MAPERGIVRPIDGALLRDIPHENVTIRDTQLRGFQIRVRHSIRRGLTASYRVELRRGRAVTLGRVGVLQLKDARELARKKLAAVTLNLDAEVVEAPPSPTLGAYIDETYGPWIEAHARSGAYIHTRLERTFKAMLDVPMDQLTAWNFEQWRTARRRAGKKPATINRDLEDLRALYSRAVKWGHVGKSPLIGVPRDKVDQHGVIRFLSPEEEAALREALVARDDSLRLGRENANKFRRDRGYPEFPPLGVYPDHLTPIVLLALNTGLRFGEITKLTWADVLLDASPPHVTVHGYAAKSGQTRHVELNRQILDVLRTWKPKNARSGHVFPGPDGDTMVDIKTSWMRLLRLAKIDGFRFHDLRHTFASKLVMRGVDLNTVRELLGHADIKMTLRYAHLAPAHRAEAVEKLLEA